MANTKNELQAFARRIEERIIASKRKGSENMENLVCRLITNKKNPAISAKMTEKWVEWRYGKATEHVIVDGRLEHTFFDASKLTDEQLAEAEQLIESANVGSDQG